MRYKITAKTSAIPTQSLKDRLQQYLFSDHTCKNKGTSFAAVMEQHRFRIFGAHGYRAQASLIHNAEKQSDTLFVGMSTWLDEKEGTARVEVSFMDDIQALRAFHDASQILNNAL